MSTGYEDRAEAWVRFARADGHDAYWSYRESFFSLLPADAGRVLEVGCGEGRVCRDLRARGHDVVGLDASQTLVAAAQHADPGGSYVCGVAESLPFADASFDTVVAYNSLMDVADMPRAVMEIGRVLRPGGLFCACVMHPFSDAGRFSSGEATQFVIDGSYFDEREYEIWSERNGIEFLFRSRRHTLESYTSALAQAGLLVEVVREPRPTHDRGDGGALPRWETVPLFLHWRARRVPGGSFS